MHKIQVFHTSIHIHDYKLGDREDLERMLSLWNPSKFRLEPVGFAYDEETKTLRIPRGIDIYYLEKTFQCPAEFIYTPDKSEKASIILKAPPRDDIQRESIAFLLGENKFMYTKKYSQLLLNLDPGVGKTYITTAAITFMREKSIILTHSDKIKYQWYETFMDMTDLSDNGICDISGSKMIDKLLSDKNPKFKVYLVNHQTIRSYAKKNGWESIHELFKHLKIGIKVFDEAHLSFESIIQTDLYTNVKKTIYLTATFERSDYVENVLFKKCTRNIVRYGSEVRDKKRKHIVYIGVTYNSKPPLDVQASMSTIHGFSGTRYADYCMCTQKFFDTLGYVLDAFTKKEGKIMILSSKIESCSIIKEFVEKRYPNKTVSEYHSKKSDDDKERALGCDIIASTSKSAGTGVDIPGLRTLIMTESYSSKVIAEQVSGRLREYSPKLCTYYIEFVDTGFRRVENMYKSRLSIFKKKCVEMNSINMDRL